MGETSRSECVAGMDMLNDMFQRQARRLESQLYQRAQDQRNIELAQQQAKLAMAKLRQLEQVHQEQVVRLQQGNHSLRKLQQHVHEFEQNHEEALEVCSALHQDVSQLRGILASERPEVAEKVQLKCLGCPSVEQLRQRAAALRRTMTETERSAIEQLGVGVTPTTPHALGASLGSNESSLGSNDSTDEQMSNPLHDLSVLADYASKAHVSQALMGSPLSSARSLSQDVVDMTDVSLPMAAAARSRAKS